MRLEYQIVIAFALDMLIGDPRRIPHPVRLIGRMAERLESPLRRNFADPKTAGVLAAVLVIGITASATALILLGAYAVHEIVGTVVSILLLYTGLAARDMIDHSSDVQRALESGDRAEAALRVGMICGRDTDRLDEPGMVRATVESVAENVVDGVTAPLFFAALGGPIGIMIYKAINTLDSTFGYKNEKYIRFGWASARLDDIANFVPARVTACLVPIAAFFLGMRPAASLTVYLRDRHKHPSPNSGHTEAAFAGALGMVLGGLGYYGGVPSQKPTLGDPIVPASSSCIGRANRLMVVTVILVLAVYLAVRALCVAAFG
ncbi:MAG: adenosylcobinamide-phosphate synthase CbiB [Desulfomonilaceae bacterium]|nr:adenosylcobinamide-phosphate synthase CbiB [Desulfomonilaceae bacterium]